VKGTECGEGSVAVREEYRLKCYCTLYRDPNKKTDTIAEECDREILDQKPVLSSKIRTNYYLTSDVRMTTIVWFIVKKILARKPLQTKKGKGGKPRFGVTQHK
jgi:hypothetical protein